VILSTACSTEDLDLLPLLRMVLIVVVVAAVRAMLDHGCTILDASSRNLGRNSQQAAVFLAAVVSTTMLHKLPLRTAPTLNAIRCTPYCCSLE
jgi:hypothetical protein